MNKYHEAEVGLRRAAMSDATMFADNEDRDAVGLAADNLQDAGNLRDNADDVVTVWSKLPPLDDEVKLSNWLNMMACAVGRLEKR